MIFVQLFVTFFEIGLFGFGGGYGMLSLIQTETVVRHHWLSTAEFTNIVATFALVLPSFLLMILISKMFMKYTKTAAVQNVFAGLRPAVVGLLAAATLLLCNDENFSSPSVSPWQFGISLALFAATFVGTMWFKVNPIRMICYAALAGLLLLY